MISHAFRGTRGRLRAFVRIGIYGIYGIGGIFRISLARLAIFAITGDSANAGARWRIALAGVPTVSAAFWIPAFAGMAGVDSGVSGAATVR